LRFGMGNGGAGAAAVIVIWGWENRARHNFLQLSHFFGRPGGGGRGYPAL
jgi:hypothetical protein